MTVVPMRADYKAPASTSANEDGEAHAKLIDRVTIGDPSALGLTSERLGQWKERWRKEAGSLCKAIIEPKAKEPGGQANATPAAF